MQDTNPTPVPKWPFFLGDAAMLGIAWFIYSPSAQSHAGLGHWEISACAICVALGAALGILPFILDYRARLKTLDAATLGSVSEKLQKLEQLAVHISAATTRWEFVHNQAEKTATLATEITDRITNEAREFTEFMSKANDSEKATLRLESEKLRRAEADWLQVLVHVLDHIHALHVGASRSGQPRLIQQISQFQNACRDAARRVGVVAFAPAPGDAFDSKRHQLPDGETASENATVSEVLGPGISFQGRLVRPALVRIAAQAPIAETASATAGQDQLSLEPS